MTEVDSTALAREAPASVDAIADELCEQLSGDAIRASCLLDYMPTHFERRRLKREMSERMKGITKVYFYARLHDACLVTCLYVRPGKPDDDYEPRRVHADDAA